MKRIVLTKISMTPNIAHIYEHIFNDALDEFFQSKKLYRYLDYEIDAQAFFNGLVYINVTLLSKEAIALETEIPRIKVDVSEDKIDGALWQITAELCSRLWSTEGQIEKHIQTLAKQPWVNIKDFDVTNIASLYSKTTEEDIEFTKTAAKNFKTLKCEFILDPKWANSNQDLIPLFAELSHVLSDSIATMLAVDFYYYPTGPTYTYKHRVYKETANLRTHIEQNPKLSDELEACKDCIDDLLAAGAIEKLVNQLQNVSYEPGTLAPDEIKLLESTGFYVGKKGWHRIATVKNALTILNNITLKITYGTENSKKTVLHQSLHK